MAFFGVMPKRPEPAFIPGALSVEGPTPTPSASPRGNVTLGGGVVGGEGRARSSWGSAASGGSAWCGGEEVVCCWAISMEGGEGLHSFGCWGAWVVEVRGEESVDRGKCRVLMDEEWLQCVE